MTWKPMNTLEAMRRCVVRLEVHELIRLIPVIRGSSIPAPSKCNGSSIVRCSNRVLATVMLALLRSQ